MDKTNLDKLRSEGDINLSPRRREWASENIDDETKRWLELDAKYFLHQSLSTPCLNVLKGCEGLFIEDLQGRKLMDFHGNNVHQVGFSHPSVVEAITRQMQELSFCTRRYTNIPAIQLAEKLTTLVPGDLNRVLFAPNGANAIGMALKLARAATGRHKTISMWDSFHGASLDAISIGGEAIFGATSGRCARDRACSPARQPALPFQVRACLQPGLRGLRRIRAGKGRRRRCGHSRNGSLHALYSSTDYWQTIRVLAISMVRCSSWTKFPCAWVGLVKCLPLSTTKSSRTWW